MMNEPIDPITLVGKRVLHNCGDPNCTLQGTVIDVIPNPDQPLNAKPLEWFVVVKFDPHNDLPEDYDSTQPFPMSMIKVIDE